MIDNDDPAESFEQEGETHRDEQPRDRIPRLMCGDDGPDDGEEHRYRPKHKGPQPVSELKPAAAFVSSSTMRRRTASSSAAKRLWPSVPTGGDARGSGPVHGFSTHADLHKLRDGYDGSRRRCVHSACRLDQRLTVPRHGTVENRK